jgi:hypothetical protein
MAVVAQAAVVIVVPINKQRTKQEMKGNIVHLLSQPHFEGSHSRKWDLGVLRDSQKLKMRFQGSKHLASRCSLYRWKGLEI